jgi:hypothetical protein
MFQSAAKDAPALPPPVSYDKLAPHSRSRDERTQTYPGVRNLFSKGLFASLVSKGGWRSVLEAARNLAETMTSAKYIALNAATGAVLGRDLSARKAAAFRLGYKGARWKAYRT